MVDYIVIRLNKLKVFISFLRLSLNPKYFKTLGAIASSSKFLAHKLTGCIDNNLTQKNILEVGAGTGPVTKYILRKLQPNDKFDIIEITNKFISSLQILCKNYNHVKIHNKSILDFNPDYKYDYIISTLPFYSFSEVEVKKILDHYKSILSVNGKIIYFQYTFTEYIRKFKIGRHREISKIRDVFHKDFHVQKRIEYRNLFPAIVWILTSK